ARVDGGDRGAERRPYHREDTVGLAEPVLPSDPDEPDEVVQRSVLRVVEPLERGRRGDRRGDVREVVERPVEAPAAHSAEEQVRDSDRDGDLERDGEERVRDGRRERAPELLRPCRI